MKLIVIILCLLIAAFDVCGQELTVKSMEVAPMDLSASTQPRNDRNGNPCALVKVLMVDGIDRVEGNVIGDVEDRGTEKWVYLSAGTKMMKIVPKNHLPLMIMFGDYGIKKVESKVTYVLTLLLPSSPHDRQAGNSTDEFDGKTPREMAQIAEDYCLGNNGRPKDYDLGVKWARKAAEQGDADAQCRLALCYCLGQGVGQDYMEAIKWFRMSGEQMPGNAYAQCMLGLYYLTGSGVPQDFDEAVKWLNRSVNQGNTMARYYLGECYYNGWGVSQDRTRAKDLWKTAAAQGNQDAKKSLSQYFNE